jgi:hypothetical protein
VLRVTTSIGDAVIATDLRGRVSYMNAIAGDLTGGARPTRPAPLDRIFRVVNEATARTVRTRPCARCAKAWSSGSPTIRS